MMPRLAELIADRMASGGFADRQEMFRELDAWRKQAELLDTQLRLCNEKSSAWRERYAEAHLAFEQMSAHCRELEAQANRMAKLTTLRDGLAALKASMK